MVLTVMYASLRRTVTLLCTISVVVSLPNLVSLGNDSVTRSSNNTTSPTNDNTWVVDSVSGDKHPDRPLYCFTPSFDSKQINVNGCRPSLTELRNYESYTLKQAFSTGDYPRPQHPHKPPYIIHPYPSTCNLTIESNIDNQRAWFSFKDARNLATEILQYCEDEGHGLGGWGLIGEDVRGGTEFSLQGHGVWDRPGADGPGVVIDRVIKVGG